MFSTYKEVWKIVKKSIQPMQIVAFSLSAFIGVFVILFAIHCYLDFKEVVQTDNSIFKEEFVIVSKKVSTVQVLAKKSAGFSEREIKDMKKQEFCKNVALFQPSRFHVFFTSDSDVFPLKTDLFFESVPDKYLSVKADDWGWNEGDDMVDIIMPRNFIALYNFGYAPSQGRAQIPEDQIKRVIFKVRLTGNGKRQFFNARVVDFSDRINTVLVPQQFLTWANNEFGDKDKGQPSRLIVETDNISDSRIFEYVADNNYQINENSLINSKLSFYLKLALSVVVAIGLVITVLAVWLLVFSFQLIIEKNKFKIQNLFYIGYSFKSILRPYNIISIISNVVIVTFALWAAHAANNFVIDKLGKFLPIKTIAFSTPLFLTVGVLFAILLVNFTSIRKALLDAIS